MNIKNFLCLCFVFFLIGCNQNDGLYNQSTNEEVSAFSENLNHQKVNLRYEIIGTPIINKPVGINIHIGIDEPAQDIVLYYRINAEDDLRFGDNQIKKVNLLPLSDESYPLQQVIVIPKREGRVFLVVSADIESKKHIDSTSIAIPIDVASSSKIN